MTSILKTDQIVNHFQVFGSNDLLLCRHGESTANLKTESGDQLNSGQSLSIELTPKGEEQARSQAKKLISFIPKDVRVAFFSSDATRAIDTADIIFSEFQDKGIFCSRLGNYEGLREVGLGPQEGLWKSNSDYQNQMKIWKALPAHQKQIISRIKGGESYQDAVNRAVPDLIKIFENNSTYLKVVITSNGTLNALVRYWNQTPLSSEPGSDLPSMEFGNCEILKVNLETHQLTYYKV